MDETSKTVMLCPEKFISKTDIKLEPSHRAKTHIILLVCNQSDFYIPLCSNLSYGKNERGSFIVGTTGTSFLCQERN
jgi:hypothetical protein